MSLTILNRLSKPGTIIRSAWRLARGAVAWAGQNTHGGHELLSVDVFATLLDRSADEHAAWNAGARSVGRVLRQRGLAADMDLVQLRRETEARLASEKLAAGHDPEFTNAEVLEAMLVAAGAGEWAASAAIRLAQDELAYESRLTKPIPLAVAWIGAEAAKGRRIVAVSDTRYTGAEISSLFNTHGVTGISGIYSSADHLANKFSGRLFDIVAIKEGVRTPAILHAGDNLAADCLAPAQRGLSVRRIRRSAAPSCASPLPAAPPDARTSDDAAFAVGYQTMGPVLVAFTRLMLDRAIADGIEQLSFVARDGELLLEVAQIIAAGHPAAVPELKYLHLSRRAVACALSDLPRATGDQEAMNRLLGEAATLRGGATRLEGLSNRFGLPVDLLAGEAKRMGLVADSVADVRALFADPATGTAICRCIEEQKSLLLRYLVQEKALRPETALVDCGWKGSIQSALAELPMPEGLKVPRGFYLGLWDDGGIVAPKGDAIGVLCDQRKSRTLLEGSAFVVAQVLESVCRADHGMVVGFREEPDGSVCPVHSETGATREAERRSAIPRGRVREGILAYAQWFAHEAACAPPRKQAVRRAAQEQLFRLAFFPNEEERSVGRSFVYTEPVSDEWYQPLILSSGRGLAGWLQGARSPWKGGYLRGTGGVALAAAYCLAEATLSGLPPGARLRLRQRLMGEG